MSEPDYRGIDKRLGECEQRHQEMYREMWGHPAMQRQGFVEEMRQKMRKLGEDQEEIKSEVSKMRQEKAEERAEKRGRDRVIGATGITSLLTLLTMIGLIVAIWQGLAGG